MASRSWSWVALGALLALCGCATSRVVRPEPISLAEALADVVRSLNAMADVEAPLKSGLVPAEVVVRFDVTAAQRSQAGARIEVVPTGLVTRIPRIGGSWTTEIDTTEGNQITVTFRSILFATEKELLLRKTPEEIDRLFEKLRELGWNVQLR